MLQSLRGVAAAITGTALTVSGPPAPPDVNPADLPKAPPSEAVREMLNPQQPAVDSRLPIEANLTINKVIYPSAHGPNPAVVTDHLIAPLLQNPKYDLPVLNAVAEHTMRELLFAESLDPDRPSNQVAPYNAANSKPFQSAYWDKFIKGTDWEKIVASPEKLSEANLKKHIDHHPEILSKLATDSPSDQRDMLARMMKYSAPLQSAEIEQKLGVSTIADPRLAKAHELLQREAPGDAAGQIQLVKDIAGELKQLPDDRVRKLAIEQALLEIKKFGESAATLLRGELQTELQLTPAQRVEKEVSAIAALRDAKKSDPNLDVTKEIEAHRKIIAEEVGKLVTSGAENHEKNGESLIAAGLCNRDLYLKVREIADIEIKSVALGVELNDPERQGPEGWRPQLKSSAPQVTNASQVVQAFKALVGPNPHDPDTQALAKMLRSLPERFKPVDPSATDVSLDADDKQRQMTTIREQLRKGLATMDRAHINEQKQKRITVASKDPADCILAKASPEDRKVIAPYLLGTEAAADAARIKAALEAAKADPEANPKAVVMGVLREIKSEVELARKTGQSGDKITRERATDAVRYYNYIEKDAKEPSISPQIDGI